MENNKIRDNSDLLLYLKFDGNLKDTSEYSHVIKSNSNPNFVSGVSGQGINIKNKNNSESHKPGDDYYFVNDTNQKLNFGSDNFSIGFWYKSSGGEANGASIITNKDYSSGNNIGFSISQFEEELRVNFKPDKGERSDIYRIYANDNRWHYLFINFDRSDMIEVYIDGQFFNSSDISSDIDKSIDSGKLTIGADINGNSALKDSLIDELRLYNRGLTKSEINNLFSEKLPPITEEILVELHKLESDLVKKFNSSEITENQKKRVGKVLEEVTRLEDLATNERDIVSIIRKVNLTLDYLKDPTDLDFQLNIFSDTHINDHSLFFTKDNLKYVTDPGRTYFEQSLNDLSYLTPESNVTIFNGDNNDNGSESQYELFYTILKRSNVKNPLLILGNHEARFSSVTSGVYKERYLKWNREYMGDNTPEGQLYWSRWIDGYHFIGLNTELGMKDNAYISKKQLKWLEKELADKKDPNKPVFIQIHQTFKGTANHIIEDTIYNKDQYPDNFIEKDFDCEEALKNILVDYPEAVILTGHVHNGPDLLKVYSTKYGHVVDLPSFSYTSYGQKNIAIAYQMQVKGTKVKLKLRDYRRNVWLPSNEITFDIKDA